MILLSILLYALGFISGFLLSKHRSAKFEDFQNDYILEILDDNLKLKILSKKKVPKKIKKKVL